MESALQSMNISDAPVVDYGKWLTVSPAEMRAALMSELAEVTSKVERNYNDPEDLLDTVTAIAELSGPLTGLINMARLLHEGPAFTADRDIPKQLHVNGMFILSNEDLQRMAEQLRDVEEADHVQMDPGMREAKRFFADETPAGHLPAPSVKDGAHDALKRGAAAVLTSLRGDVRLDAALNECLGATMGLVMLVPVTDIESVMLVNDESLFGSHRVTLFQLMYFFYTQLCCAKMLVWDGLDVAKLGRSLGFGEGNEFPVQFDPFWLTRAVQAQQCARIQYRGGAYAAAVASYSLYFAYNLHVRMPLSTTPAEKLNETVLRMAYFHWSVHRASEWTEAQQWSHAVFNKPRAGPEAIFEKTELLDHMYNQCGTLELDFNSKRQMFDLTAILLRCHGDALLFGELQPFLDLQPVVILDMVSSSPWRQFCKNVDRMRPHQIVQKPSLLIDGLPEGTWSWEAVRPVLCLMYIYLFDFVVCATPGDNSFVARCVKIFPDVYPPNGDALNGSVQIVGSHFYVRYGARYIDCGDDPNLLIEILFTIMVSQNNAFKSQCQKFHIRFHSMRRAGKPGFDRSITRQTPYKTGISIISGPPPAPVQK